MPHALQNGVDHDPHRVRYDDVVVFELAAFVVARVRPAVAVAVFVVVRFRVTTGLALLDSSSRASATATAFLRVVVFAVLVLARVVVFAVPVLARVVVFVALAFVRVPVVAFLRVVVARFLLDAPGNASCASPSRATFCPDFLSEACCAAIISVR